ncbi:MAG: PstS family phosphate ABC transporter substrate-binding protein [Planctomycetota bacterium]
MHRRLHLLGGALALIAAASCSKMSSNTVGSTIDIDGSSTVVLISEAVVLEYRQSRPDVDLKVGVSGTGGGFERFCVGETEISNASRPIKQSELARAAENGIDFIELPIAFDGLTFAVHKDNTWADSLTVEEIRHIFRSEDPATTWADVRDGWPAEEIDLYTPAKSSGTLDFFLEVVFPDKTPMRADVAEAEDDHILVRGITGSRNALGFFGYAYYAANRDRIRSVPIDDGTGAIAPSVEAIADGSYRPFSRPLFIYVNLESAEREDVRSFVTYYLDNAQRLSEKVGYVGLPDALMDVSRDLFENQSTGTVWLDETGEHLHDPLPSVYGL